MAQDTIHSYTTENDGTAGLTGVGRRIGVRAPGRTLLLGGVRAFFLAVAVSGCGTVKAYNSDDPYSGEPAVIRSWGAKVLKVNTQDIPATASAIAILPGRNTVMLEIEEANFNSDNPNHRAYYLDLDAKPGRTYIITGKRGQGSWCAFELNEKTGDPDYANNVGCVNQAARPENKPQ